MTLDFERLADGAELVAIAGANGRGKTTLMDNMHPYLVMPSRAALSGPGGFSYYDHVCLPENEKDLTWSHEGRCYRSQVVIRLNGRRKTEAYLHALSDEGQWRPVCLDDGLVSDGKVETYTRCVEAICGSADTFFTSAFSAQGKRQLSTYRNAEIKSLLSDLLCQEEIRAFGQKANDTAKLIKAGLLVIRQESAGLDAEQARLDAGLHRLQGASDRVAQALIERQQAQQALGIGLAMPACRPNGISPRAPRRVVRSCLRSARRWSLPAREPSRGSRLRSRMPCRAWSAWRNALPVGGRKRSLGKARSCNHAASA
ncbi:hypothetical protein [Aquabacterium sp.]|uniref:hypothetical protein n=1 Tax=Aquabacterium sp. TaxID=1872578 RepID=UPI004037B8A6